MNTDVRQTTKPQVHVSGKLPDGSTIAGSGRWPHGAPLAPGIAVTFTHFGEPYTGQIERVIIEIDDETNGRSAIHPITLLVNDVQKGRQN